MKVKSSKAYVFGVVLGILLSGAVDARAAVITSLFKTSTNNATGTSGAVGLTPAPNNDNSATPSPNLLSPSYFLRNDLPIEFEFNVSDSLGTTEYRIEPRFTNVLGAPWTNFYFELGFGMGANFVRSGAGDGLDFDTPNGDPSAASGQFSLIDHGDDALAFRGGSVGAIGSIGSAGFVFFIDVPDGLSVVHPGHENRFTLRITPNGAPAATPVPEPGTMMLIGSGVAALVAKVRRRRI
jgi:hypothetical protein